MKRLLKTTIALLILIALIYVSANYVLKELAVKVVEELRPRLQEKGIMIEHFNYSNVRLNSYNSLAISKIDLEFYLKRSMYGKEAFDAQFESQSIIIRFADFNNPSFFFTFKDFSVFIKPDEENANKTFGKLENGYLKSRIPVYLKTPEASAREIIDEVKKLFQENKTAMDLVIQTDVFLGIDQKEVKVGLYTERKDDWTFLKFNDNDILMAAKSFDLELTKKEAEIIANYPSKVPAMIKITRDAKRLSEAEKDKYKYFPEDAYRHIYWSYHLTREFGPELAKEITDAHETAPGNTKEERQMDFHNNEIGRLYAKESLSLDEIRRRVLQSNDVVRNP